MKKYIILLFCLISCISSAIQMYGTGLNKIYGSGVSKLSGQATIPILYWNANATLSSITDGYGTWLSVNQWWNGSENQSWINELTAAIGSGGTGNAIALEAPVSISSLLFPNFKGTYTIQPNIISTGGNSIVYCDITKSNFSSYPIWPSRYVIHAYTTAGTNSFVLPSAVTADVLVAVAGGGGGGGQFGVRYNYGGGSGGQNGTTGGSGIVIIRWAR